MTKLIFLLAFHHLTSLDTRLDLRKIHMQKILVVLNNSRFSESTLEYAIHLSKMTSAHLVGVFLDETINAGPPFFQVAGEDTGIVIENTVKKSITKKAGATGRSVKKFEARCKAASVKFTKREAIGYSVTDLIKETIHADLLVIHIRETSNDSAETLPSHFLKNLLMGTRCPVLLAPDWFTPITSVAALYNGDASSVLAVKMFSYLFPELDDVKIQFINLNNDEASSEIPGSKNMKEWVEWHFSNAGYNVITGNSRDHLIREIKRHHYGSLIIAGAYQRSLLSMLLHPSLADSLIKRLAEPIFIAHY